MRYKTSSFFIISFGAYLDCSCRVHATRVIIICPVRYCIDSYSPVLFFSDLLMCNVDPHKSMQQDIKMAVHRGLLTSAHA